MFEFEALPWPLSKNSIWRCYGNRVILSAKGREYHAQMAQILTTQGTNYPGPVQISLDFYPPTRRRFDLDGRIPVLLDALVRQRIIADDDQVMRLIATKHEKQERQGVWVKIEEWA